MAAYLIRRLWQMVPTLIGVVLLVFFLFKYFGGDPAEILGGLNATPEQIEAIRDQLGLNEPVWVQLGIFVKQIVSFDWGKSWATNESVAHAVRDPPAGHADGDGCRSWCSTCCWRFRSRWRGLRARLAHRPHDHGRHDGGAVDLFLVYVIVGQYVFAFQLGWFPVQGWSDSLWTNLHVYAPLPVLLAVLVGLAPQMRLYRTFFLDEIGQDYVRTARAKGLTRARILLKHVLRNAMIPILTNVAVALPGIFVGSFLIETFFSIPGLGREVLLAVNRSDYPGHPGGDDLHRRDHDGDQPADRRALQVGDPRVVLK